MRNAIQIDCPSELLLGLHLNVEDFAILVKQQSALALFTQGRISSGMAARWLGISRVRFLMLAMETGYSLLEDSLDDLERETSLL